LHGKGEMMNTGETVILGGLTAILIAGLSVLFGAILTWLLWNWLMPVIFKLPEISLLQSVGLLFLSWILLKSNVNVTK
jgi:hypothetical protein